MIDPRLADTLIVLIPKVDNPKHLKQFRPISLCNVVYKIITKVLVNRVRPFLHEIVSPLQGSFIPGRGTSDNIIITQEVIHSMHQMKGRKGAVAFKIDLEKAYDRVNWDFLRQTLIDFGFPMIIVNLVMNCVQSSNLSILWNGAKLEGFAPSRGLRQGDPMSPYLFVLCMEKLAMMIQSKVDTGDWQPVNMSRGGPAISHLFFADDVLLFCKAKKAQVRVVMDTIQEFCSISGLKVNVEKSRAMCSPNVNRRKRDSISSCTSIRFTSNIGRYLGIPILRGRVRNADFHPVIEKLKSRLATWKSTLLNKAGKVCLARSVFSSIPINFMQALWIPRGVCSEIDRITRKFIWSKDINHRGLHLVNWETVTKPTRLGGLGIRQSRQANVSLLGKHVWKMLSDHNSLSVQVLKAKYLKDEPVILTPTKRNCSYLWCGILKAASVIKGGFSF